MRAKTETGITQSQRCGKAAEIDFEKNKNFQKKETLELFKTKLILIMNVSSNLKII
jgi:hypothetical protein